MSAKLRKIYHKREHTYKRTDKVWIFLFVWKRFESIESFIADGISNVVEINDVTMKLFASRWYAKPKCTHINDYSEGIARAKQISANNI